MMLYVTLAVLLLSLAHRELTGNLPSSVDSGKTNALRPRNNIASSLYRSSVIEALHYPHVHKSWACWGWGLYGTTFRDGAGSYLCKPVKSGLDWSRCKVVPLTFGYGTNEVNACFSIDTDAKPSSLLSPYVRERRAAVNPGKEACPSDRYTCDETSKCIPLKWICDGHQDCDDKKDERNCIYSNQTEAPPATKNEDVGETAGLKSNCPKQMFSCEGTSKCLLLSSLCDTVKDCEDGSDERNCRDSPDCSADKFHCDSGAKCLPLTWICDGIDDCSDKNDEHNCPERAPGKSVARAAEEVAIAAAQEAKSAAITAQQFMRKAKEAADKAERAIEIAEVGKNSE